MNRSWQPALPPPPPVVFIVDHDEAVRDSIDLLIRCAGWQSRPCSSGGEFLALPRATVSSCVVSEIELPDLSGLELQRLLADRPELPIVFIAAAPDVRATVLAMKAGAVEVLTKPCDPQALLEAVQSAIERSAAVLAQLGEIQTLCDRYRSLTRREKEVMALVLAGLLNKQIGGELGVAEVTVKAHRAHMMRKMGAASLLELGRLATKLGLGEPAKVSMGPHGAPPRGISVVSRAGLWLYRETF